MGKGISWGMHLDSETSQDDSKDRNGEESVSQLPFNVWGRMPRAWLMTIRKGHLRLYNPRRHKPAENAGSPPSFMSRQARETKSHH